MIVGILESKSSQKGNTASGSETEDSDDEIEVIEPAIGWLYVGSHNFTPSAWGNMSGSAFTPVLNIKNYELGIVFPIKDAAHLDKLTCWRRPPRKYGSQDLPWMQEESKALREAP
ncbi:hypothetical protein HGRIS_006570 [Hohenbuehelia grisea]|uniref:Uncharacterized protein n=1 Tax=Hohenbuehelia grisea TaxID=104357 RepID=A0ABR3J9C9_9AGAR